MRSPWRSLALWLFLAAGYLQQLGQSAETVPPKGGVDSPSALVTAALQAELDRDHDSRKKWLTRAVIEAPHHAPARWHSGQVPFGDEWLPVVEAEKRTASDPLRTEYRKRRQLARDLESQIALARWCRKNQLDTQEQFHWAIVLQLAPGNKEALIRLGLQEYLGQYLTREQIESYKLLVDAAEQAMKKWKPLAQRWRTALTGRDAEAQKSALREIEAVREVEALAALEEILSPADARAEMAVVGVLSRMEEQIATDLLVRHAILSEHAEVRNAAAEALSPRSFFAYVPALMGALKSPVEYSYFADTFRTEGPSQIVEWRPVANYVHTVFRSRRNAALNFAVTVPNFQPDDQARAMKAEKVRHLNSASEARNQRIFQALTVATHQQLPQEPQAWWTWWINYNELQASQDSSQEKQRVLLQATPTVRVQYRMMSCFLPGTKVWLDSGPVSIEKVQIGDRVLAQDPETGELNYRFVLQTTVRPPSSTLRIGLPNEEIATTLGHPIWVVGKGWRMAKEIAVGDYLHGVHGGVPVEYLEKGPESNAFNLVVADFNTYFIGEHRVLVHDNTARRPTIAVLPGFVPKK